MLIKDKKKECFYEFFDAVIWLDFDEIDDAYQDFLTAVDDLEIDLEKECIWKVISQVLIWSVASEDEHFREILDEEWLKLYDKAKETTDNNKSFYILFTALLFNRYWKTIDSDSDI